MKVHIDELKKLDWPWPPHARIPADSVGADGVIDLDAVARGLEQSRAFYKREQDAMYAFAAHWNAPIDETTDRREEVADAIMSCDSALAAVRKIMDAISADPPRRYVPPKPYVAPEYTPEALASFEARDRLPTRDELVALLNTYFEGPADVDRFDRELRELERDRSALALSRQFLRQRLEGNFPFGDWRGQLWAERIWNHERSDRSGRTLAAFHVAKAKDGPKPRPYCPELIAGTWHHNGAPWTFGSNGELSSPSYDRWAVILNGDPDVLGRGNYLLVGKRKLLIRSLTTTRMDCAYAGYSGDEPYIFERPVEPSSALSRRYELGEMITHGTFPPVHYATVLDGGHPAPRVVIRVLGGYESRLAEARELAASHTRSSPDHVGDIEWRADEGEPILHVMEDLSGHPTLDDVLRTNPQLPVARACRIAMQLASAVHAARWPHHRLRPNCIYLQRDDHGHDHVKVVDFGLAHIVANPNETRSGPAPAVDVVMYMAPERLRRETVGDADVYSIGAILYTMLAGRTPFAPQESVFTLAMDILTNEPRPLTGLPREVIDLVERAMQRDVTKRLYAHQLRDALRDFV